MHTESRQACTYSGPGLAPQNQLQTAFDIFSTYMDFFFFLKKPIFFQATPYATHMDGNKVGGNM